MNETGSKTEVTGKRSGDGMDALLSVPADTVESLRAHVNRLHAERGVAVLGAKKSREEQGFKSAAFQMDWAHVENLTGAIVHYEAELEKAVANNGETPLKRAAVAAMDLFDVIDKLGDEDAVKAIEVVKQRAKISMLGHAMRKAVPA